LREQERVFIFLIFIAGKQTEALNALGAAGPHNDMA